MMQIGVETVWQVIDGSFSGDKKSFLDDALGIPT